MPGRIFEKHVDVYLLLLVFKATSENLIHYLVTYGNKYSLLIAVSLF